VKAPAPSPRTLSQNASSASKRSAGISPRNLNSNA
jgi:hypothetical protein